MSVDCPLCGKEVSSHFYLGQHIDKTDDAMHNGVDADDLQESSNPGNIVDHWRENTEEPEEKENDSMKLNEVSTVDEPSDKPDYMLINDVNVKPLTESQIQRLIDAKEQGYTKIENSDKPIGERDIK